MKTTMYIPDEKVELYERAKTELGESLSATFVKCLERELQMKKLKTERIVLEITDLHLNRVAKKAFQGRWLVGDESNPERHSYPEDSSISGSAFYAVAQSAKGAIVVASGQGDEEFNSFEVHDGFEEFRDATYDVSSDYPMYPESLISAVADALDIEYAEELDI